MTVAAATPPGRATPAAGDGGLAAGLADARLFLAPAPADAPGRPAAGLADPSLRRKCRLLTDAAAKAKTYIDNAIRLLEDARFDRIVDDKREVLNTFRQLRIIMPQLEVRYPTSGRDEWPAMCGRPYVNMWSQGLRRIYVCNRAFRLSNAELARSLVHEMTHNTDPRFLKAQFGKETPVLVSHPGHWRDECFAARMEVTAAALAGENHTSYLYTQRCGLDAYGRRLLGAVRSR